MASRFETFFKSHASPVLRREFNQQADFIDDGGVELRFNCYVDMDEIPSGEGFADLQGRVSVKTADLLKQIDTDAFGEWVKLRYRDEMFDIYSKMPDEYGSTVFNVRRRYESQQHSNIFDITGRQVPFA